MFSTIIVRNVRGLYGFVEPFRFDSDIKKAIVIYFTLMRFVNELFALLSGLSKNVVPGYFEQSFSTIYGIHIMTLLIIIRAKLLINIVIHKYGSHFLIGSD